MDIGNIYSKSKYLTKVLDENMFKINIKENHWNRFLIDI